MPVFAQDGLPRIKRLLVSDASLPLNTGISPVDGALRDAAWAFCHDLASALLSREDAADCSLANGGIGPALYLATWHRASHDESALAAVQSILAITFDQLSATRAGMHWFGGLTGTTWALRRLLAMADEGEGIDESFSETVDQALAVQLGVEEWRGDYDLISGLVGIGLYALEHPDRVWREHLTGEILRHLVTLKQYMPTGAAWFTRPESLPLNQRTSSPGGYYNLGVAHGVPGVIGFLARCVEMDCHVKAAADLLVSAVDWTLAQSLRRADRVGLVEGDGYFASVAGGNHSARLAWCYGDLGICLVLLRAANALDREDWRNFALEVARHSATRRTSRTSSVTDMGLCHGSAGAAFGFLRLWQQSGDAVLAEATSFWLEQTLAMRDIEFGRTAGVFRTEFKDGQHYPVECVGYLTGAAGVGLAVLTCVTGGTEAWDAPLLTDLPVSRKAAP